MSSHRIPTILKPELFEDERRRASWVRGLARRLNQARQREEDWAVSDLIQRRGGRLTDSLEREIANRLLPLPALRSVGRRGGSEAI